MLFPSLLSHPASSWPMTWAAPTKYQQYYFSVWLWRSHPLPRRMQRLLYGRSCLVNIGIMKPWHHRVKGWATHRNHGLSMTWSLNEVKRSWGSLSSHGGLWLSELKASRRSSALQSSIWHVVDWWHFVEVLQDSIPRSMGSYLACGFSKHAAVQDLGVKWLL